MSRNLCLTRQCFGLVTRIECSIRPLAGDNGMWTLLFAAGMAGEQPSSVKSEGPFRGPFVAQSFLKTIVENLTAYGYEKVSGPQIWCLHMQALLRQLNGNPEQLAL
ncbi:PA4575 family protein [Pseudomonas sp. S1_E04]